jgi:hypothetical protein
VELDNAIYSLKESEWSGFPPDQSSTLPLTLDIEDKAPIHASLFENPEFESFGTSFYYSLEDPWTPADLTYKLLSSTPLRVDSDMEDLYDGDAAACDKDSVVPPEDYPACVAALCFGQVATPNHPTSSHSYSGPPAFSYPSPESIVEQDITEVTKVEEDYRRDSPVPPSFARPNKRAASRLRGSRAKKRRVSATPISVSSTSAVRFPCSIPGCKQVCKTLGDLKRHESILAHKPPSWECHRCHYQFTREDALKRHNKNVPNCANANTNPRGRPASMKLQRPREVEVA